MWICEQKDSDRNACSITLVIQIMAGVGPNRLLWRIGLDCICLTTTHVLKDILAVFDK